MTVEEWIGVIIKGEHEENLNSDGIVLYLDCGDTGIYMLDKVPWNCTHTKCHTIL